MCNGIFACRSFLGTAAALIGGALAYYFGGAGPAIVGVAVCGATGFWIDQKLADKVPFWMVVVLEAFAAIIAYVVIELIRKH